MESGCIIPLTCGYLFPHFPPFPRYDFCTEAWRDDFPSVVGAIGNRPFAS